MFELRAFMFENVYKNDVAKKEEVRTHRMLEQLFEYYVENIDSIPTKYINMINEGEAKARVVCDYIAGMTDQYAVSKFNEYFMPKAWEVDNF